MTTQTAAAVDAMLGALDRLRDTGPEYGGFLANHGPMAADAMVRLGGHGDVEGWVDRYRRALQPAVEPQPGIDARNWADHLGRAGSLGRWQYWFDQAVRDGAWATVLDTWWPRLLPGLAASATHGVIRTAHAVRNLVGIGDEPLLVDELARGLAYWAFAYQTLPGAPSLAGSLDVRAAADGLPRLDPGHPDAGRGIGERLAALGDLTGLPAALDAWSAPADPAAALDDLAGLGARLLANRDDSAIAFCHAVTAPAAVRMILPTIRRDLHSASVAACWQAVAAITAAYASPAQVGEAEPVDRPVDVDRHQLAEAALEHGDEHVLKLTEACLRQHDATGDATLLLAADRFRRRTAPRR